MSVIQVPYHLDEYLPELDVPLPPDTVITADLPAGDVWAQLGELYSGLAAAVAGETGRGGRPVVVSGDCTTALGTMSGLQQAGIEAGIVWFDAHGDVQTLETTTSGYLGGLPLRLLAGYRPELIAARLGLRAVPERHITWWAPATLTHPRSAIWRARRSAAVRCRNWMPLGCPAAPCMCTWTWM
jgi:arginase